MRLVFFLLVFATLLFGHNLEHTISKKQSVVISFSFGGENDFSFQNYEVYSPLSEIPFAVGRTDALSRVSFLPNTQGKWKVKVFSEDGHGKIAEVKVDADMQVKRDANTSSTLVKTLIGILLLLGIFGLIYIVKRKNKDEK